jgi:hypothetical protein
MPALGSSRDGRPHEYATRLGGRPWLRRPATLVRLAGAVRVLPEPFAAGVDNHF